MKSTFKAKKTVEENILILGTPPDYYTSYASNEKLPIDSQ